MKYVDFLRENHLYSVNESEESILKSLIEDSIICAYLSDVTGGDPRKANDVKDNIKSKHSDIIEKLIAMSKEIETDRRR